jgi:hypothetical protein
VYVNNPSHIASVSALLDAILAAESMKNSKGGISADKNWLPLHSEALFFDLIFAELSLLAYLCLFRQHLRKWLYIVDTLPLGLIC